MRALEFICRLMPYIVLGYAIQGWIKYLLGVPCTPIWGLPAILWYTLCGTTAVLVLIITWLERQEHP